MPWWGWIAVGTLLLAAEMGLVDAQFYLVFLGVSALLVGLLGLGGVELSFTTQWLVFAVLAVGSLVVFRQRVYGRLRATSGAPIPEGVVGDVAVAEERIEPGATGSVKLRGSRWNGRNAGDGPIEPGARCRVERVEGLLLQLRAE